MKIISLILCSFITCQTFAQNKKDNTIIIHGSVSNQKIIEVLFSNGYVIETKDSSYITTKDKSVKTFALKLAFLRSDTAIILKGYLNRNITFTGKYVTTQSPTYDIYFGGMKGSPMKDAWYEMDKIAKQFGDSVEYVKQ